MVHPIFIIGLLPRLRHMFTDYQADPPRVIVFAILMLMQALALYFVFSADARPWFRKPREIDPEVFS